MYQQQPGRRSDDPQERDGPVPARAGNAMAQRLNARPQVQGLARVAALLNRANRLVNPRMANPPPAAGQASAAGSVHHGTPNPLRSGGQPLPAASTASASATTASAGRQPPPRVLGRDEKSSGPAALRADTAAKGASAAAAAGAKAAAAAADEDDAELLLTLSPTVDDSPPVAAAASGGGAAKHSAASKSKPLLAAKSGQPAAASEGAAAHHPYLAAAAASAADAKSSGDAASEAFRKKVMDTADLVSWSAASRFENWLDDDTEEEPGTLNCWEYVLYLGVKWGGYTKKELKERALDGYQVQDEIFGAGSEVRVHDPKAAHFQQGDAIVFDFPDRHTFISLGGDAVADLGGNLQSPTITTFALIYNKHKTHADIRKQSFDRKFQLFIGKLERSTFLEKLEAIKKEVNSEEELAAKQARFTAAEWARIDPQLLTSEIKVLVTPYREWVANVLQLSAQSAAAPTK